MFKFYIKVLYVMGKVLSGELSCTKTGLVVYVNRYKYRGSNFAVLIFASLVHWNQFLVEKKCSLSRFLV